MVVLICIVHSLIYEKIHGETFARKSRQEESKLEGKDFEMGTLVRNLLRLDPWRNGGRRNRHSSPFSNTCCKGSPTSLRWTPASRSRTIKWFNLVPRRELFRGKGIRVLAHALMLFDKRDSEEPDVRLEKACPVAVQGGRVPHRLFCRRPLPRLYTLNSFWDHASRSKTQQRAGQGRPGVALRLWHGASILQRQR